MSARATTHGLRPRHPRRPLPPDLRSHGRFVSMRRRRSRLPWFALASIGVAAAILALLLSGCGGSNNGGGGAGTGNGETIMHPQGADELVVRMEVGGGFVPVDFAFSNLPQVSIFGDGSVITQGPVAAIFPGPALPNLQVANLSEDGLQILLAAALEAGLLEDGVDYGQPLVADASTTTFIVATDGATVETAIYHLTPENFGDSALTPEQKERREHALEFQALLYDLAGAVGEELGPEESYEWTALRMLIQPADPTAQDPSGIEPGIMEWPLDDLATMGEEQPLGRVAAITGADLETVMPQLQEADQLTIWHSGDGYYRLALRPLLPDEVE
jgi:hypothetical protein